MRHIDFAPLYRSTVGFDRLFNLLDGVSGFDAGASRLSALQHRAAGRERVRITMAVAGFSEDELKVDVKEQALNVRGEKKAEEGAPVPAPRHRRAHVRAPLPARRPRRGQGRRSEGRPAPHRPRAQRAGAAEAAHRCDRQRQGREAGRGECVTDSRRSLSAANGAGVRACGARSASPCSAGMTLLTLRVAATRPR